MCDAGAVGGYGDGGGVGGGGVGGDWGGSVVGGVAGCVRRTEWVLGMDGCRMLM